MGSGYRAEKRGDSLLDAITDEERGLRFIVSRLGAELISLQRRAPAGTWTGFLYRDNDLSAPAAGWANHATVMGYYLHRLKEGRSCYRGREIRGGTHGFLRDRVWTLTRQEELAVTYRMTPDDYAPEDYPLRVSLDLTYALEEGVLVTRFKFLNHEPELTAHVGFGLHPGFGATTFESFRLLMPGGKYRRYFSPTNYLSGETQDLEIASGPMPFPRERLPGSFILEFVDVPDRRFRFHDDPTGRVVEIDLADVPYVTLWSDGGPFLCLEPCWGLTDHEEQKPFEDKVGLLTIPPGGRLSRAFRMAPHLSG